LNINLCRECRRLSLYSGEAIVKRGDNIGDEIKWVVEEREAYTLVQFELPSAIEPSVLKTIAPPAVNGKKGVVISGRGPVWLYAYLVHHYHPTAFIATYDPRLGAVVVASHAPSVKEGDVIPL